MNESKLATIEINPPGAIKACVIWLHGLGADGHDFEPIVPELRLRPDQGVRFVFPYAPQRPVTINGGYVMRAWYDIVSENLEQGVDEPGILASERQVTALVEDEIERGISASRIVLAGFSQGGVIALGVATRFQPALGGLMMLSSYVALPQRLPDAMGALPVFMAHGTQDTIAPYRLGKNSHKLLIERGYEVQWHDYPMPHAVCSEEINDIRDWLAARLESMAFSE